MTVIILDLRVILNVNVSSQVRFKVAAHLLKYGEIILLILQNLNYFLKKINVNYFIFLKLLLNYKKSNNFLTTVLLSFIFFIDKEKQE